jgi:hypothetical protein
MKRWLDAKRRWGRQKILIKPTEGELFPTISRHYAREVTMIS